MDGSLIEAHLIKSMENKDPIDILSIKHVDWLYWYQNGTDHSTVD